MGLEVELRSHFLSYLDQEAASKLPSALRACFLPIVKTVEVPNLSDMSYELPPAFKC